MSEKLNWKLVATALVLLWLVSLLVLKLTESIFQRYTGHGFVMSPVLGATQITFGMPLVVVLTIWISKQDRTRADKGS